MAWGNTMLSPLPFCLQCTLLLLYHLIRACLAASQLSGREDKVISLSRDMEEKRRSLLRQTCISFVQATLLEMGKKVTQVGVVISFFLIEFLFRLDCLGFVAIWRVRLLVCFSNSLNFNTQFLLTKILYLAQK